MNKAMFDEMRMPGFFTRRFPGQPATTWATILGDLLRLAERQCGPRDKDWTILGVEFGGKGPSTWLWESDKFITLYLSETAVGNTALAIRQLGHETIHALNPTREAKFLEEGLAVAFSDQALAAYGFVTSDIGYDPAVTDPNYYAVGEIVRAVLGEHPGLIRALRSRKPLHAIEAGDLIDEGLRRDLAEKLAAPFVN